MNYYYDQQLSKYLVQFMAIFQGMQVKTNKRGDSCSAEIITVPIQMGSKDRVAAAILNQNTQNKPLRLPVMSAYYKAYAVAPERRKAVGFERKTPYVPLGGLVPDDVKVIHQYMPIPYNTTVDLSIYTSNLDQHFQILEQIFVVFDPIVQIQTNDSTFDWTKITTVELKTITPEEHYPPGRDRRMLIITLSFFMPIYISAPAKIRNDAIKDIYLRVGSVHGDLISQDVVNEFNAAGMTYDLLVSAEDELGKVDVE